MTIIKWSRACQYYDQWMNICTNLCEFLKFDMLAPISHTSHRCLSVVLLLGSNFSPCSLACFGVLATLLTSKQFLSKRGPKEKRKSVDYRQKSENYNLSGFQSWHEIRAWLDFDFKRIIFLRRALFVHPHVCNSLVLTTLFCTVCRVSNKYWIFARFSQVVSARARKQKLCTLDICLGSSVTGNGGMQAPARHSFHDRGWEIGVNSGGV